MISEERLLKVLLAPTFLRKAQWLLKQTTQLFSK